MVPPTSRRSGFAGFFAVFAAAAPGLVALEYAATTTDVIATCALTLASVCAVALFYQWRPVRVLIHVLLLVVPVVIFYRYVAGGAVTPGVLLSIRSTNPREAAELLGAHPWVTSALGLFLLAALAALWNCWYARDPFSRASRWSTVLLSVGLTLGWAIAEHHRAGSAATAWHEAVDRARSIFPMDVVASTRTVAAGYFRVRRDAQRRTAFRFPNVHAIASAAQPDLLVVVIGEASRRRNWSLYGYARSTTPRLAEIRSQLYVFDNISANANLTIYSVPLALMRATPASWHDASAEQSVIGLLRQGGFQVHWISNQDRFGRNENATSTLALESDSTSFSEGASVEGKRDPYDSNLVARLSASLSQRAGTARTAVSLHSMGSHFAYSERYPATFDVFGTRSGAPTSLTPLQRKLYDSYDNSILFTDTFLRATIDAIAALRKSAAVVYFADHGERLFDADDPSLMGHGFAQPSIQELEVPLLIWLSPEYRAVHPDRAAALSVNEHARADLDKIFESLVDLAGLTYDGRPVASSLLSAQLADLRVLQVLRPDETVLCHRLDAGAPSGNAVSPTPVSGALTSSGC